MRNPSILCSYVVALPFFGLRAVFAPTTATEDDVFDPESGGLGYAQGQLLANSSIFFLLKALALVDSGRSAAGQKGPSSSVLAGLIFMFPEKGPARY